CTKYAHIVKAARTLIAVFLEKRAMYHSMKDHQSAGACIQNMLLAAHALGLGAVWLGEIVGREAEVLEVLGLNQDAYQFMAVLALGRAAHPGASSRKPLSELLLEEI
ncbi:MAG: nitroreductase family protein, partial [Thermodesulfobacteriota bacterium]|nr:nitroreductase family protein [Thermodesulfobacteriota bacterium]